MSKITITIEDLGNMKVRTTVDPNMESLLLKCASDGNNATAAEGYAMAAILRIRQISNESAKDNKIVIPRLY